LHRSGTGGLSAAIGPNAMATDSAPIEWIHASPDSPRTVTKQAVSALGFDAAPEMPVSTANRMKLTAH
jgi:hypothetical protein